MSGSEGWEERLEAAKEGPGAGAGMMMIMASPAPLETGWGRGLGGDLLLLPMWRRR